jgi:hypothetical protein
MHAHMHAHTWTRANTYKYTFTHICRMLLIKELISGRARTHKHIQIYIYAHIQDVVEQRINQWAGPKHNRKNLRAMLSTFQSVSVCMCVCLKHNRKSLRAMFSRFQPACICVCMYARNTTGRSFVLCCQHSNL